MWRFKLWYARISCTWRLIPAISVKLVYAFSCLLQIQCSCRYCDHFASIQGKQLSVSKVYSVFLFFCFLFLCALWQTEIVQFNQLHPPSCKRLFKATEIKLKDLVPPVKSAQSCLSPTQKRLSSHFLSAAWVPCWGFRSLTVHHSGPWQYMGGTTAGIWYFSELSDSSDSHLSAV